MYLQKKKKKNNHNDYFTTQRKLTGFYNRDEGCLLCGKPLVFKYNSG
jgi:hypothetical protein